MAWGDDTRTQYPETLYSFRLTRTNTLVVAKWAGGREPIAYYMVTNQGKGFCDCQGSRRKPYCKHRQMIDKVDQICQTSDFKVWGCYYDYDKDLLYCPADGEGIPLDTGWMTQIMERLQ